MHKDIVAAVFKIGGGKSLTVLFKRTIKILHIHTMKFHAATKNT